MVAAFLHPWSGTAFRHIPAGSRYDVLDTRFAALAADNRWNEAGEPTFYLAGDLGVALAEYARHLREDVGLTGTPPVHERAVYQIDVRLQAVLDLRDPAVRSAVGLHGGVCRFLDRGVARATAHFVRRTTPAEAVLVPSVDACVVLRELCDFTSANRDRQIVDPAGQDALDLVWRDVEDGARSRLCKHYETAPEYGMDLASTRRHSLPCPPASENLSESCAPNSPLEMDALSALPRLTAGARQAVRSPRV